MGRFRKEDVEFHADGYGPMVPAVNVKVYRHWRDVKLPLDLGGIGEPDGKGGWGPIRKVFTEPAFTHDWIEENIAEDYFAESWDFACQMSWEQLQDETERIFGSGVKVWSEGRSGGWAIVHGIDHDVESWNALAVSRWGRFARYARLLANDVPRQILDSIYNNVFLPSHNEAVDRAFRDLIRSH